MTTHSEESANSTYHGLVRRDIFPLLPPRIECLLDVGGGVGATAAEIKTTRGVPVAGVIDMVPRHYMRPELDFHLTGNVEDSELLYAAGENHGPFDVILCLDILEHLVDPWGVVRILHQILRPNGVIIASIPNVRHISVIWPLLFKDAWDYVDAGLLDRTHLRFFVKRTAIELMTSSGLELDLVVRTGIAPRSKNWIANKLTLGLFESFLTLQYLIRVRNRTG